MVGPPHHPPPCRISPHTTSRSTTQPTSTPATQLERSAANRLRTTFVPVRLAFTWLGVRRTLAPEQRTTAARAFHADRELLSASKLILDTKNPAYRAVAAVRSEASGYWRTVTLPFPEPGIRLLPQNSLGLFASTMAGYRERLQQAAQELAAEYEQLKAEAQRRLGTLFNPADYPGTLDGMFDMEWTVVPIEPPQYLVALNPELFQQEQARVRERFESAVELAQQTIAGVEPQTLKESNRLRQMVARDFEQIQAAVGEMLVDRPRRNILRRGGVGGAACQPRRAGSDSFGVPPHDHSTPMNNSQHVYELREPLPRVNTIR
jgi:hypothetical protein